MYWKPVNVHMKREHTAQCWEVINFLMNIAKGVPGAIPTSAGGGVSWGVGFFLEVRVTCYRES